MGRHVRTTLTISVVTSSLIWAGIRPSTGQLVVTDPTNLVQSVITAANTVASYAKHVQAVANQYEQLRQQLVQIEHAAAQVRQGVTNLQHFDVNYAEQVLGLTHTMQTKLQEAQQIGYQAQHAVAQAEALYPQIAQVLRPDQVTAYQQQWAYTQREAAKVSVNVQAIYAQHQDMMTKVATLMHKTSQSQGNLDTLQGLAQGQGLVVTQLVSIEEQLATQGRLQAVQALQNAALQEATAAALRESGQTLPTAYTPAGHLLQLSR